MLKHIPQSWKDDMRTNFAHKHDFYINPRGRVLPALTSEGISYIKNDGITNMRGTYRMQCGASTSLTYLYTLPQRFIIEGWFKPEFAYDSVTNSIIQWNLGGLKFYGPASGGDGSFFFSTRTGSVTNNIHTDAFASDAEIQKWIYVRCFFDNISKLKGFYCTVNGVVYENSQNVPGAGDFISPNIISFMPTVAAESSYWIIHELDETLATGEYKTYQADRQVIFDFNGTTLGRERILIPTIHTATEHRGVQSFSMSKSVENPMTGSAGANTASMKLLNVNGQFSDDQYDTFDPFQGMYNGTQKYLQNRVPVEIESTYSRTGNNEDIPNGSIPAYARVRDFTLADIQEVDPTASRWAFYNGTTFSSGVLSIEHGRLKVAWPNLSSSVLRLAVDPRGYLVRFKISSNIAFDAFINNDGQSTIVSIPENTQKVASATFIPVTGSEFIDIESTTDAEKIVYIEWVYVGDGTELTDPMSEPLFMGRTTPGAFKRSSPNKFYGDVSINIEDGISELGETKLRRAYAFDAYDICDPAVESDSLVHSIARLVTKKEIRNYALNSSFENSTISNSWTNTGMSTFERSNTHALFGTYSMKCVADTIGDEAAQYILFETIDKIDVGDSFNFSAYILKDTASAVLLRIYEYDSGGSVIVGSTVASGVTTGIFTRENIPYTITSSSCTRLKIVFIANAACTFYVDGVMLTRGIDPIDYFLLNATDGASGSGSADLAATTTYDTVAFDCDAVNVEHPYALVDRGSTAWDALKKIGDASIASYIGMSPDGVFQFKVRYNEADMPNMGDIEDFGGIATSLDVEGANAVKVHGVIINGTASSGSTPTKQIWSGEASGIFQTDDGNKILHPISDASYMSVSGATEIELKYSEDL